MSLLMTVTSVTLYRAIRQLSLPCAVVELTICVSSRYSNYLYLYYVRWARPPSLKCYLCLIFFVHFLFEWRDGITMLPSTGAITCDEHE